MKTCVLVVVLSVLFFIAEGTQTEKDELSEEELKDSKTVSCIKRCFHTMIDNLGTIKIKSPVVYNFGKQKSSSPDKTKYPNELDQFKALCSYYKETLESCVNQCGDPSVDEKRYALKNENRLMRSLKATCVNFYDGLVQDWDCIVKLRKEVRNINECEKCDESCNVHCLDECVQPSAEKVCGSSRAIDFMKELRVFFERPVIANIVRMSKDEKRKDYLDEFDKNCVKEYEQFLNKYPSSSPK